MPFDIIFKQFVVIMLDFTIDIIILILSTLQ